MRNILILVGAATLAACGSADLADVPADNSPVAPEVVCEETADDNSSECVKVEAEVAADPNYDGNAATGN